jgi:formate dehydrogenase
MRTATAAQADIHVAIRPGQDWAFLLGVLKVVLDDALDAPDTTLASGVSDLRALAGETDLAELSARCDVPTEAIVQVAREFAGARSTMCVANTGVSQTANGTLGEWLSHVLNFVTDRVDRPGCRRLERGHVDVGKLWGRMARPSADRSRVGNVPAVGGYRSLGELAEEITVPGPGRIRAMVIVAGNLVVSGAERPRPRRRARVAGPPRGVDLLQRESRRHAHWLLPTAHWLERCDSHPWVAQIQDQPDAQAVQPPAGVREDWEIFTDLAIAMRRPLFGVRGVNTLVRATRIAARLFRRPSLAFHPPVDRAGAGAPRGQGAPERHPEPSARVGLRRPRVGESPGQSAHRRRVCPPRSGTLPGSGAPSAPHRCQAGPGPPAADDRPAPQGHDELPAERSAWPAKARQRQPR